MLNLHDNLNYYSKTLKGFITIFKYIPKIPRWFIREKVKLFSHSDIVLQPSRLILIQIQRRSTYLYETLASADCYMVDTEGEPAIIS